MSLYELDHPLGQEIEKVHGAFVAGMADMPDLFADRIEVEFVDAMASGEGFSRLKMANWTTRKLVWLEYPVLVSANDPEWLIDYGGGLEPVMQRVRVKDMLFRDFITTLGEHGTRTPYLVFDVTTEGVAVTIEEKGEKQTYFGEYDGVVYGKIASMAMQQGGIAELAILADAV